MSVCGVSSAILMYNEKQHHKAPHCEQLFNKSLRFGYYVLESLVIHAWFRSRHGDFVIFGKIYILWNAIYNKLLMINVVAANGAALWKFGLYVYLLQMVDIFDYSVQDGTWWVWTKTAKFASKQTFDATLNYLHYIYITNLCIYASTVKCQVNW